MLGVVKLFPLPNNVPPIESEYHLMVPVPVAVKPTIPVPHLAPFVPVGVDGTALTVAVTAILSEAHPVTVLESNAKYVIVDEILGVVKLFPVDNKVPPVNAEYHLMLLVPVADRVTVPVPHLAALITDGGTLLIVAVTAVLAETHPVIVLESKA